MTARELLQAGRARLGPGKWVKRTLARDKTGQEVLPWAPDAFRFCALGALRLEQDTAGSEAYQEAVAKLYQAVYPEAEALPAGPMSVAVVQWNDEVVRQQADVLALYDRALEASDASE
jgi:hypothetical protein